MLFSTYEEFLNVVQILFASKVSNLNGQIRYHILFVYHILILVVTKQYKFIIHVHAIHVSSQWGPQNKWKISHAIHVVFSIYLEDPIFGQTQF